ncbi:hypothetical protein CesoFtcFv8_025529 [Champsocephalus esox]|uniref:Uncharacterized protein n=2 Tax=Champsocephalus TaxID=52236 RepID=A0AAN8C6M1_CHAGU|nr:hypothetical protein CesoFtcFv8_025529 [Champsocephalus esox]KAK5898064.1 hypothetical protein CgunFtcFv8_015516 [Champsocephalus gunnari]
MSSVITGRQHCAWYWQPHALARRPESCCPMGATLRTPPHSRPHFCFHARNSVGPCSPVSTLPVEELERKLHQAA